MGKPTKLRDGQTWRLADGRSAQVVRANPPKLQVAVDLGGRYKQWQDAPALTEAEVLSGECYYDPDHLTDDEIPGALIGRRIADVQVTHSDVTVIFDDGASAAFDAVWLNTGEAKLEISLS